MAGRMVGSLVNRYCTLAPRGESGLIRRVLCSCGCSYYVCYVSPGDDYYGGGRGGGGGYGQLQSTLLYLITQFSMPVPRSSIGADIVFGCALTRILLMLEHDRICTSCVLQKDTSFCSDLIVTC